MKSVSKKKIATIAIILCFAFLLTLTILTFTKSRKMTDAESIALHDYSDSLINYFDNFKETEGDETSLYQKELAFAIDYFYYSSIASIHLRDLNLQIVVFLLEACIHLIFSFHSIFLLL